MAIDTNTFPQNISFKQQMTVEQNIFKLNICKIYLIFQFQVFQHNYTGRGVKVVIFSLKQNGKFSIFS